MSTNYADLYDWVMPDVPTAPTAFVTHAIREAVIALCERALIWRQELQQILVLGPTSTITTAAAVLGATSILVADITNFNDGDTITVGLDTSLAPAASSTALVWRGHVSGTPVGSTINLDGQLPAAVDISAPVTKLVYLYPITLPSGAAIAKGTQAWLNDNPIDPISEDDLDSEFNNTEFAWLGSNWRTDIQLPTRFYFPDDTMVGLALAPNSTGALRINAALKPTRASTNFPTWIFERFIKTIAHGAKATLMLSPHKPYSDPKLGLFHDESFNSLCGEARVWKARSNTRAPLRTHTVYGLR